MGLFATFSFVDGRWAEGRTAHEPSLTVDVHDSDIATVDYRPVLTGTGTFHLGCEPRTYFDDDAAGAPVDAEVEARAFAEWVRAFVGGDVDPAAVRALLPTDDEDDEPVDVFVEDTVTRLLELAGLPLPPTLTGAGDVVADAPARRRRWFGR